MEVAERIRSHGADLTAAERRVAEAILAEPQAVAFGTVAELARRAKVGAASVVRLAGKLGFDGFSELQHGVQDDLSSQLRPAAERIQEGREGARASHVDAEIGNIRSTIDSVADDDLDDLVARLADLERPVAVLSGVASAGVVTQFAAELSQLRAGVHILAGSEVRVRRDIALLPDSTTAVVVDLRRYEKWVLRSHQQLVERSIWSAGLTDSLLSPIASCSDVTFVLSARAVGPFDSHVGTLALLNLVVSEVAGRLQQTAAGRLAAIEEAWSAHDVLSPGI